MANAKRDQNFVTTLLAVSSVDGVTPVTLYANPTTHRLLVDLAGGGSGTVQTIAIASANGFAGTSDGDANNPTLTLSTTITGILKGNGTAISAVTIGSGLSFDGTTLSATGTGTPGGSDTQVQYNNAGAFGGITGATTDGTTLTLVAPVLGTPASATLTNATGLPVSTGISGLGTGVAAALAVNTGSAGAFVVFDGALGTPSSGTVTNLTGTASININGTVGATTPTTATFTTATINTSLLPDANDGAVLGAAATAFSDLFLASGAVIGFANGDLLLTHSTGTLTISDTDAGATGPILELYQDSASPAANDAVGTLKFFGEDSASNKQEYARIEGLISDTTSTSEDGFLRFWVTAGGAITSKLTLSNTGLVPTLNDGIGLGEATLAFSDLFLAEGAVINWDNGDLTLTQTGNELVLAGGNLDIGTNILRISGNIDIDGTPASDDTFVGPSTDEFQASATIAQWEAVYLNSSSQWALTDADAAATAGTVMVALATEAGTLNNAMRVALPGTFVRNDAWTWTVGAPIYLSTTPGALTQTAPSATDDVVRIVGYAMNADVIFWNPSNDFITIV